MLQLHFGDGRIRESSAIWNTNIEYRILAHFVQNSGTQCRDLEGLGWLFFRASAKAQMYGFELP